MAEDEFEESDVSDMEVYVFFPSLFSSIVCIVCVYRR